MVENVFPTYGPPAGHSSPAQPTGDEAGEAASAVSPHVQFGLDLGLGFYARFYLDCEPAPARLVRSHMTLRRGGVEVYERLDFIPFGVLVGLVAKLRPFLADAGEYVGAAPGARVDYEARDREAECGL